MFFAEIWKVWKRRPRAFTSRQHQRHRTPKRLPLFLEALEDRTLLTAWTAIGPAPILNGQVSSSNPITGTNGRGALEILTAPATPPVVTTNPTNQTVIASQVATFKAAANGNPTPTVQWQVSSNGGADWTNLSDDSNISGATSTMLTLSNVPFSMNGYEYRAIFSNSVGATPTSAATLTVKPAKVTTTAADASAVYSSNAQTLTLHADVADASIPTDTVDEGSVTFTVLQGRTPLGSVQATVSHGSASASFNLPARQAVGRYTIAVSYRDSHGNFTDGGDRYATLTVNAAATTVQLTQISLTPNFIALNVTETLTCHVSSSSPVDQGTVTFKLLNLSVSALANVDANGNATVSLTLPMSVLEGEFGGWLTHENIITSLALPVLGLVVPQVIAVNYTDPAHNLMASADPEGVLWSPINAMFPSTATFSPNGQIVTANLFGFGPFTCIYNAEGFALEIDFIGFHLLYSYNASNQLMQIRLT